MNGIFERDPYFPLNAWMGRGFLRYAPSFHVHAELVYVIEGSVPVTVDGIEHTLVAGEIAFLFPYLTHSYEKSPDSNSIVLLFDPAATFFDDTLLTCKPSCFYREGSAFCPMMERIVSLYRQGCVKTARAYLNAVVGELLELLTLEERGSADRDITMQLLSYCEEHYTEPITAKSVADALYISQSYVSKVFAKKLRCSFREYINALRVQRVTVLLRETDKMILQIMSECGFQNQSNFNRVFRSLTGMSPKEYRAEQ